MQELYEKLSTDERKVLHMYHERGKGNSVNLSEAKLLQEKEGTYQFIMPVKVLQTTVFNEDCEEVGKKVNCKMPLREKRMNTPKTLRKTKGIAVKNSGDFSESSRGCSVKKGLRKCCRETGKENAKVTDFTKIPNWKYEVNKLIRAVVRHTETCSNLIEESAKIGGLKIIENYKKYQKLERKFR